MDFKEISKVYKFRKLLNFESESIDFDLTDWYAKNYEKTLGFEIKLIKIEKYKYIVLSKNKYNFELFLTHLLSINNITIFSIEDKSEKQF